MGVLGLWQLLAPVGQPVTLESLENKIFSVDISIWLNQALKGYRDSQGGSVPNAHLLSLFSRLCKLLFYKIRPIIVFDGGFPELKKQTIINRQKRRAAVKQSSRDVGLKILSNYVASQQLNKISNISCYNTKTAVKRKEKPREEIFKLPPLPESSQDILSESYESVEDNERKFTDFSREDIKYLNQIDLDSEDFNSLPPDVKLDILSTLKESKKHRSWDQYDELPKESNDFSNYQMQCLLKKRKLQSKLEHVQKNLREINSSAYVSQYTNNHVIGETNKIMSDDTSYYVLLKKIQQKGNDSNKKLLQEDLKPGASVMADTKYAFIRDIENIDDDDFSSTVFNDMKNEGLASVSTDINLSVSTEVEKNSLNLSDEEYDVDDPPFINAAKEANIESINKELNSKSIINNKNQGSTVDQIPASCSNEHISVNVPIEISCELNFQIKHLNSKDESSDIVILPVEQNSNKVENVLNETVEISSEDEMIPCEEENINIFYDKFSKKLDGINRINLANERPSVSSKTSYLIEKDHETNLMNKTIEEASSQEQVEAASAEGILNSLPSTSKQFYDSMRIDENLHEANLELQKNLDTAAAILEAEQAKQDRQSRTVQDHMIEECKELLQLFGIPYIVSPLEAEAQCAFYDKVDLTHGTITDDSDVWLFGGKRVYKNFFTQQKFVECYKDKEIFAHFGLSRMKLINFALLTGSDYTEGIEGIGPVTAMEVIAEFAGEGIDALQKFKDWWEDTNKHARPPENKVRAKLQKLVLSHNFPDNKVFEAYLEPEVDSSTEKFTWGRPDLDAIREYAKERFGWNQSKVDDALLPVLKKLNERDRQTHLDSFFTVTLKKDKNLFPSKRIMSALKKITSPQKQDTSEKVKAESVKRKAKPPAKKVPLKKVNRKTPLGRGGKKKTKCQGPVLSEESSSESDS